MRKVTQIISKRKRKRTEKQIQLLEDEKLHVGIDAHKNSYYLAIWSVDRNILISTWRQPANMALLCRKLEPYRQNIVHIVYEASFCGYTLVRTLQEAGFDTDVI